MKQYLDLAKDILETGNDKGDRTGTGTLSVFGRQLRFNLEDGFPLVTTKKVHMKSIIHELLWFLKGDTNIKYLQDNGVRIWNEWSNENGDLGPVYGHQWRKWARYMTVNSSSGSHNWNIPVDQIHGVIDSIKNNPNSRRHIVSAWNVSELDQMALHPCHILFQFYVHDGKLSLQMYQRSADYFLGVPFNIASYSLLLMMIAQVTGLKAHEFIHTFGDVHIYKNHIEQMKLQITREPKALPTMELNPDITDIDAFKYEDFKLVNYESHPLIKGKISV